MLVEFTYKGERIVGVKDRNRVAWVEQESCDKTVLKIVPLSAVHGVKLLQE